MDTKYNPETIEQPNYQAWENANQFAPSGKGDPYCIMIPPPNVTGSLHMGHAFQDTLMDLLTRYHRMQGRNTLWQVGTDHAGIATQMVVERQLDARGLSRHDLGRDKFIETVWDWKKTSGGTITQQLRRMGASVDWSRERFTMDEQLSAAVQKVFIELYDEGLIYRGKRLVNWDPVLHTALSDLEVVSEEEPGHLWHLKYPLSDGTGHVIVATTRPETMLGDTAVAVHPEDERYQSIIGKTLDQPLTGRKIPVIADDYVDPEFGSGCVKITPAHDFNDYDMGKRHDLEMINILTIDAKLNDNVPEAYQGLDRFVAREKIVEDLDAIGALEKIEAYTLKAPRGDRSGAIVEPFLTDQWYVKIEPLAKPAIEAVESGKIKFVPENWSKTYFEWMNNIQDWCISRQLWWGHRIPAWYDAEGNIYVGKDLNDVRQKYSLTHEVELSQDNDVLDTWFSSALWTFSTLGWPEKTDALKTFHPTSVLVTGFDIIFFWVARMIMMTLKFTGEIPFNEVYIHGLVRDAEGQKMSKSKGNILDPIDLIDGISLDDLLQKRTQNLMRPKDAEKIAKQTREHFPDGIPSYGADALRFTFAALASTGRDIRFDLKRIEGYRNFCNKLWNASRYVLMNVPSEACRPILDDEIAQTALIDQWIISRLNDTVKTIEANIKTYRFDLAAKALYQFVWHEFCDWYLELSKPILSHDAYSADEKLRTQQTLWTVLSRVLRMAHPFIPYITESLWKNMHTHAGQDAESIMLANYPQQSTARHCEHADSDVEWLKDFVVAIRTIRSEMNIAPSKTIPLLIAQPSDADVAKLKEHERFLKLLSKLDDITLLAADAKEPASATALIGKMKLLIPLKGLIDVDAEVARLKKAIEKETIQLKRSEAKLNNESFVGKAPAAVIKKEKAALAAAEHTLKELNQQLVSLESTTVD